MYIVFLKFSANKSQAGQHMAGHKDWIRRGFEDGVFLLTGSLKPGLGGMVLAHNISTQELQNRVDEDPFVAQDVVRAEILEIEGSQADARLQFLLG